MDPRLERFVEYANPVRREEEDPAEVPLGVVSNGY